MFVNILAQCQEFFSCAADKKSYTDRIIHLLLQILSVKEFTEKGDSL